MRPSKRSQVRPFLAMEVLARANAREAAGASVLHLEVGEPGGGLPERARRAVAEALAGAPLRRDAARSIR